MHTNPLITGTRVVLAVRDLQKSVAHYRDKLGMESLWAGEGWHFLKRGTFVVMLGECTDEMPATAIGDHSYVAYIEVVHIDELYREFQSREIELLSEPEDKPWGQREFGIRTPDGHRFMFGEEISD